VCCVCALPGLHASAPRSAGRRPNGSLGGSVTERYVTDSVVLVGPSFVCVHFTDMPC